ncbi:MAG: (2Fe-2S) ferredoxin domain-containing protein, partial [Chloroflexota bacterium]|nr:(2Fe-2S) ferredoxin domain-containing protein [Chloroflexota bacterium]
MPKLKNSEDLISMRLSAQEKRRKDRASEAIIFIGMGTCGIAAGAAEVADAIRKELDKRQLDTKIINVGCIGICVKEPLVDIKLPGKARVTY